MEEQGARPLVRAESEASPVTFVTRPRRFELYQVTEEDLDGLARGANSFSLALFGITAGVATTGLSTLLTADLTLVRLAIFAGVTFAATVLTLFFGVAAIRERRQIFQTVEQIKGRGPSVD